MSDPLPKTEREAVACSELLACPLPTCGGAATLTELRYANTGNIYGYTACCDECGLELSRQPAGWPCGYEQETMAKAKEEVLRLWNTRHANSEVSGAGATASNDNNESATRQRSLD